MQSGSNELVQRRLDQSSLACCMFVKTAREVLELGNSPGFHRATPWALQGWAAVKIKFRLEIENMKDSKFFSHHTKTIA